MRLTAPESHTAGFPQIADCHSAFAGQPASRSSSWGPRRLSPSGRAANERHSRRSKTLRAERRLSPAGRASKDWDSCKSRIWSRVRLLRDSGNSSGHEFAISCSFVRDVRLPIAEGKECSEWHLERCSLFSVTRPLMLSGILDNPLHACRKLISKGLCQFWQ